MIRAGEVLYEYWGGEMMISRIDFLKLVIFFHRALSVCAPFSFFRL
jgi:hypothetical protein